MARPKSKAYLLFSTVSSQKEARKIAEFLVQKRLAACVNIIPNVISVFRWKGKMDRAKEFLLVIKTKSGRLEALKKALILKHSYNVPELIGFPISWGHQPYLKWLQESV